MKMRFSVRVFLLSFFPIAFVLLVAFVAARHHVEQGIKEGVRASLRETHEFIARSRADFELQNSLLLNIVAQNPRLRAGIESAASQRSDGLAQQALEWQLAEYGEMLDLDVLHVRAADGAPLALAVRRWGRMEIVPADSLERNGQGVITIGDEVFVVSELSVDFATEQIGSLTIGRAFDLAQFSAPIILSRDGEVIGSSIAGLSLDAIAGAMSDCQAQEECEVELGHETMLSLEARDAALGEEFQVRSLQSIDRAGAPVRSAINEVFFLSATLGLLAVLFVSVFAARSIVRPLTSLTSTLKTAPQDGALPTLRLESAPYEIDELVQALNHASGSARDSRARLTQAYTEFIASISQAVDARDVYTSGHSSRVSRYSAATAQAMGLSDEEVEIVTTGSLLHDVGKIGVPDNILQRRGPLTPEQFEVMKTHPVIGKRILNQIEAFAKYVPVVELHHENYDGTGYPHGLKGDKIPVSAHIVHVADAYDAMTSNRPYRSRSAAASAFDVLAEGAGTQFDPQVVEAFIRAHKPNGRSEESPPEPAIAANA